MKKTFKEFVEQIEKENDEFLALSKNKKKVKIAQDVLVRLKFNNIEAENGIFYSTDYWGNSVKEIINDDFFDYPVCNCCAKGSLFLSYIGRVNNYTFCEEYDERKLNDVNLFEHRKLLELFSIEELDAIEIAFEGRSYIYKLNSDEVANVLEWRKKLKQGNTSKGVNKILKAICNNIIKNDGEFVY